MLWGLDPAPEPELQLRKQKPARFWFLVIYRPALWMPTEPSYHNAKHRAQLGFSSLLLIGEGATHSVQKKAAGGTWREVWCV